MNVFTNKTVDKNDFIETLYKNFDNGALTKQVEGGAKWDPEKNCCFETLIAFVPRYTPKPYTIALETRSNSFSAKMGKKMDTSISTSR